MTDPISGETLCLADILYDLACIDRQMQAARDRIERSKNEQEEINNLEVLVVFQNLKAQKLAILDVWENQNVL